MRNPAYKNQIFFRVATWAFSVVLMLMSTVTRAEPPSLDPDQLRRAEALTSIFENATPELQYAYVEHLSDGRGYTAGRAGFTTATGDLIQVVERYDHLQPTETIFTRYRTRLEALARAESASISGLSGFPAAWARAAEDPLFRQAQDEITREDYYVPAMKLAEKEGLHAPLSLGQLYDAIIQHGDGGDPDSLVALLKVANQKAHGTPQSGVDEKTWLGVFLEVRRADLAHAHDASTRAEWAESVAHVDVYKKIWADDNLELNGPIQIDVFDYRGTLE